MSSWINNPRWKLRRVVEEYSKKLASNYPIAVEETIKCHLSKLVLFAGPKKHRETRIRSVQTLEMLGSRQTLSPGLRELTLLCKKWPDCEAEELSWVLIYVIYDLLAKNRKEMA